MSTKQDKDGKAFADEVVKRMMDGAKVGPDGKVVIEFSEEMVNEALIAIGVDPISGKPIAEKRA